MFMLLGFASYKVFGKAIIYLQFDDSTRVNSTLYFKVEFGVELS